MNKSEKISKKIKQAYTDGKYEKRIGSRAKIGKINEERLYCDKWDITVSGIEFDSGHWLEQTQTPCDAIHGHRWKVEVEISSYKLDEKGMVINFSTLKKWIKEITEKLDHNIINRYCKQPTAENLSKYIFHCLRLKLRMFGDKFNKIRLNTVTIFETPNNFCKYTYENMKEKENLRKKEMLVKQWQDDGLSKQRIDKMKNTINNNKEELKKRSERMLGELNPMNSRKTVEKMLRSLRHTLHTKDPNKHEQQLVDIFKQYNIDFTFVGCGEVIIDGKCPDFINQKRKQIIEYDGSFWHSDNNDWYDTKDDSINRYQFFKERGYETLFLRSEDLEKGEKHIIKTIKNKFGDFE